MTNKKDNKVIPITQTLNVVLQKIIQVNKPTGYYKNKEKTKIVFFIRSNYTE